MASLSGRDGDGIPFLGLLLWLQLLGLLLSGASGDAARPRSAGGGYRLQEESPVTLAGSEAPASPRHLKLPEISHPAVAPSSPAPAGAPGSGATSESTVGRLLNFSGKTNPFPDVLPSACGRRTMRIIGGREAPQRKWPWQVSLQSYGRHSCGGSLITNRLVLTAAHCVRSQTQYSVMLGNNKLSDYDENAIKVPVKDIYPHQGFNRENLTNDIAVILLAFPVTYSPYIQPVCLPERPFPVKAMTLCWVTGWGRVEEYAHTSILRETEQKILSQKTCRKRYEDYFGVPKYTVREGMICGYHDVQRRSPCWGDSGGPLVCEVNNTWIQVGVVSWGYLCGYDLLPAVYTEVTYFKKWLNLTVNQASRVYSMGVYMLFICLLLPEAILVTM